jgi:hypothetical protein
MGRALGSDIMNGEDVRMAQRRDRTRLPLETRECIEPARHGRQNLDRDVARETGIVSAVDLTHAAGAEAGANFIRAQPGPGRECARFGQQLFPQRAVERASRLQDRILVVMLTQQLLDRTPNPGIAATVCVEKRLTRFAGEPQRLIEQGVEIGFGIHLAPSSSPVARTGRDVRSVVRL